MINWRSGTVVGLGRSWRGAQELTVSLHRPYDGDVPALAYPPLVGEPRVGDTVLLNVNALELGLGTGGYAMVVALPDRLPPDRLSSDGAPADLMAHGHLVKARYTPLQAVVAGADEPGTPTHPIFAESATLPGTPVVLADLHSALPAVLVGVQATRPGTRVAYVMTDAAALPLWLSRSVAALASVLSGTVTVGQAFGGDVEAVTLHNGLLAAVHVLHAEVVVVAQGPGNLGTGTPWGFSGVAVGEAVNAAVAVGASPVAVLRMSEADPRSRHRGVSHHSLTALGRVALAAADIAVPRSATVLITDADRQALASHRWVEVDDDGLLAALAQSPVPLATMGRGLDEDPVAFLAAAAAGRHAAHLLTPPT